MNNVIKKIRGLLCKREFSIVLFFFALFLFTWPFLSMPEEKPGKMFTYLFSTWGLIIFFLFLISRVCIGEYCEREPIDKKKER